MHNDRRVNNSKENGSILAENFIPPRFSSSSRLSAARRAHFPSPLAGAALGAALFLLSVLSPSGFAQQDQTGKITAQGSTAPEHPAVKDKEEDSPRARMEWFNGQRSFPNGFIPAGARVMAIQQKTAMREYQRQLQGVAAQDLFGEGQSPQSPFTGAWLSIGPKPTSPTGSVAGTFGQTSGRVTAIAIDPTDPTGNTVFIAGAQGGVWQTTTGGIAANGNPGWTPLTDNQPSLSMGSLAIAIDPTNSLDANHRVIYAGTGEQAATGFDVYYGAGVLKSLDGGHTWAQTCQGTAFTNPSCPFVGPFSDGFDPGGGARIGSLSVNPSNPSQLLAGVQIFTSSSVSGQVGQPGIYCTNNGGTAWSRIVPSGLTDTAMATAVFYASSTTAFAALGRFLGDPTNGIYVSHNANQSCASQTWTRVTGIDSVVSPSAMGRIELTSAPNNANLLFAGIADAATDSNTLLGVFKSADGGMTWAKTGAPDFCLQQCWYDLVIRVDPADSTGNTVFAGGSGATDSQGNLLTLIRSADGGNTWSSFAATNQNGTFVHVDHHAIAFTPTGSVMYVGNDGGVWSSTNAALPSTLSGSQNWADLNFDLALTQFYPGLSINASSPAIAFGGTQDNGSQTYSGTSNWANIEICGDGGFTIVDPFVPSTVMVSCSVTSSASIARSDLNGAAGSYFEVTSGISTADALYPVPPLTADLSTAGRYYFGTNQLYQTGNSGESWTMISCHVSNCAQSGAGDLTGGGGAALTTIAVSSSNPAVVYVGASDATVQVSKNVSAGGTATFTKISGGLPPRTITKIIVDPSDVTANTAYVSVSGFAIDQSVGGGAVDLVGHIFKTTSGGLPSEADPTGWTDVSCHTSDCSAPEATDLPNTPVDDLVLDPDDPNHGTLYAATDIGVFVTINGGATWAEMGTSLPDVAVLSLTLHEPSRTLRAATHGRSVWDFSLPPLALTPSFALSSLSVTTTAAGRSSLLALTLTGRGFTANSTVLWNGSSTGLSLTGTPSATSINVNVPSSFFAQAGKVSVQVMDASHTPNTTNALTFSITGSAPSLSTLLPSSVSVGAADTQVTITGSNFAQGASATFNDSASGITTNSVNGGGTQILATISHTFFQYGAEAFIGVTNPPPGGGSASHELLFTINNPTPPPNDNVANALPITVASYSSTVDSFAATTETTDPSPGCIAGESGNSRGKSVWWIYTAGTAATVTANTIGSVYDTVLDVFTGTPGTFVEVPSACNDDIATGDVQSQVQFSTTAGVTYYFMVTVFDLTQCPPAGSLVAECGGKTVFNFSGPTPAGVTGSPSSTSITAGGSTLFTISTLAPPLSGQVSLVLSGCPPVSTCTFGSSTITAGTSTTLTVSTTASVALAPSSDSRKLASLHIPRLLPISANLRMFAVLWALALGALLLRWRRRRLAAIVPLALLLALAVYAVGCGAPAPDTTVIGTPAATYPIVITGTGDGNTTATTTLSLTVN